MIVMFKMTTKNGTQDQKCTVSTQPTHNFYFFYRFKYIKFPFFILLNGQLVQNDLLFQAC